MIAQVTQIWRRLFVEPFYWLFLCFFQPLKFSLDVETDNTPLKPSWRRFAFMLRMTVFLLLFTYPSAILVRIALRFLLPHDAFDHYQSISFSYFLTDTLWSVLIAIGLSPVVGSLFGIAFGISGGIWAGVTVYIDQHYFLYWIVQGTVLAISGIIFGITIGSARDIRFSNVAATVGSAIGITIALLLGIPVGIAGGYLGGTLIYVTLKSPIVGSILGATVGLLLATVIAFISTAIVRGSMGKTRFNVGLERGLIVGRAFCIAVGGILGSTIGIPVGGRGVAQIPAVLTMIIIPGAFSILGFVLGYSRLPLYPFSSLSTFNAYRASRKKPLKVFDFLHKSALYWDEWVVLPLPGLKQMLLLAAKQDIERTLSEISFIATERSSQIVEAQAVSLEISLSGLEACESLEQISLVSRQLSEILPPDTGLINSQWVTPLARLNDASREAARYYSPLGRQARREVLNEMIINLKRLHPERAFNHPVLTKRLTVIVEKWLELVRQELDRAGRASEIVGYIDNPYICGPALKSNNKLFVGRRDLVQRLEQALNKGIHRPHFFLTGERRMGKTSTLNQLSNLLSRRYIPIILDLQARSISASTITFLSDLAGVIYKAMSSQGIWPNKRLEYDYLKEWSWENEAFAYRLFDEWFRDIEAILEKEDKTLVLAFDEFEKLERAGEARYLDLDLLLDWFRNVIQNHPRLALLFSGVRGLDEMGANWANHFVNVKTLKVSLLRPPEARSLITQPISGYPSEEIFGEGVVDEIMRITGCHPFLIQATYSELIDRLNAEKCKQAHLHDVAAAATEVLENWATYFYDLWERTNTEQRLCLATLRRLDKATASEVMRQNNMDERTVGQTLQKLHMLVSCSTVLKFGR